MTTLAPPGDVKASNLAFGLFFLPRERRPDAMLFYRFCRTIDDIADSEDLGADEKRRGLDAWLAAVDTRHLPGGLEEMVARRGIDRHHLAEIIRGCAMDIGELRFETFAALEAYCWRVACAVGLVSIRIFGAASPAAVVYAENLGHALQLTNILRDVAEDARRGRIYLPLEDLHRFGVPEASLLAGTPGPGFLPLMQFEAGRARARFAAAVVPSEDAGALVASEIMRAVYTKILGRLETGGFPVFDRRIRLNRLEKLAAALSVIVRRFQSA